MIIDKITLTLVDLPLQEKYELSIIAWPLPLDDSNKEETDTSQSLLCCFRLHCLSSIEECISAASARRPLILLIRDN